MNVLDNVRRVADAVLYEGYVLYPYRASSQKNRSRWQFGVLMPPCYGDPSENPAMQAECVFWRSGPDTGPLSVEVTVRFLQVQRRSGPDDGDPWDEAVSCEVLARAGGDRLFGAGAVTPFAIPGGTNRDGTVIRRRRPLLGSVSIRATPLDGPWQAARLKIRVTNQTDFERPPDRQCRREDALPFALVAAHMIVTVSGGAFASATDPPEWAAPAVAACVNTGCWPVLAGPSSRDNLLLASPIILPDHPEVAAESPGELFDSTEIDEILTLRTLALTDAEKEAARATDPRAAALIDRVEAVASDGSTLGRLHGTMRGGPVPGDSVPGDSMPGDSVPGDSVPGGGGQPWWDPEADASVSPSTDSVLVAGRRVARGSRVTLRPGTRRADAQDMFLTGRTALVEAVLLDVEDQPYLAVSLVDDPAADLQAAHGRFRYFAPDEVEPCGESS